MAAPAATTFIVRATGVANIGPYLFNPSNIVIAPGDSILWTNAHQQALHDTTYGTPDSGTGGLWASEPLSFFARTTFTFTFTNAGYYPYRCRSHVDTGASSFHPEHTGAVSVVSAAVPPTVAITNPLSGASFAAPSSVNLQTAVTGSVASVEFFSSGALLGSNASAPFSFLTAPLAAGNYTFTAVATDGGGLKGTSAPVDVFLLTNAALGTPQFTNGTAFLTVTGIVGQTYFLDYSTNHGAWLPLATAVAPASVFLVVDTNASAASNRLYRARQQPTP
jgi:plastocyanin